MSLIPLAHLAKVHLGSHLNTARTSSSGRRLKDSPTGKTCNGILNKSDNLRPYLHLSSGPLHGVGVLEELLLNVDLLAVPSRLNEGGAPRVYLYVGHSGGMGGGLRSLEG